MGQYTDKMTQKCVKMSLFVRVVTHYGSNESNDSLGVFSVENIQKRVCRHILGWEYYTSYPDSLAKLELESLEDRRFHICRVFSRQIPLLGGFPAGFPPLSIVPA